MSDVDCDGTESRLLDCPATTSQEAQECVRSFRDPFPNRRGIVLGCSDSNPEEEGALRLRGGFGTPCDQLHTGFVEIFHNNEWGAITGTSGVLVPDVACRQLGFPHGTRLDPLGNNSGPPPPPPQRDIFPPYFDPYSYEVAVEEAEEPVGRVWLNNVRCSGPEARLLDCLLGRGVVQQIGLVRGSRLTVACRRFPVRAALEAVTTPNAEEGDLRLVDETAIDNWVQGRLEVFFEGSWAQVCGLNFDAADVNVACRQLGFPAGTVLSDFGAEEAEPAPKPVRYPEVAITRSGCDGSEARLVDCPIEPFFSELLDVAVVRTFKCYTADDPGLYIACVADPLAGVEEGSLRLQDQQPTDDGVSGVLEIFHAGAWGTVCDGGILFVEISTEAYNFPPDYYTGINPSAGILACNELGFASGKFEDIPRSLESAERSPPWVGNLLCIGDESALKDCPGVVFGDTGGCKDTQRLVCTQ